MRRKRESELRFHNKCIVEYALSTAFSTLEIAPKDRIG